MKKIITIIGARPQFIKAAVVSREFLKSNIFQEILVHTGQHFDKNMSDIFFEEMEIPKPQYNLNINGLSHGAMTGQMLEGIEKICIEEKPDFLLVYGDTNSTIAGALAAKKLCIKVIHVEAGLRSYNMQMPEEINRILTDKISDILYCPTDTAVNNLKKEGIIDSNIHVIQNGDVMQDAALYYASKSEEHSKVLAINKLVKDNYVLCTIHRQENTDDPNRLKAIINALNKINNETIVVVPLHPRTKKIIQQLKIEVNFTILDPVGYFDMIELLKNCKIVMTDSGGLQKEAYFFNRFCITLRDETEWVELVENGYNRLVGANENEILNTFNLFKTDVFNKKSELYGGGMASAIIRDTLEKYIINA
jgi:UDP-GlcNAc3NAcA epimerase